MEHHESESLNRRITVKQYLKNIKIKNKLPAISYEQFLLQRTTPKLKEDEFVIIQKDKAKIEIKRTDTPIMTLGSLDRSFKVSSKKNSIDAFFYFKLPESSFKDFKKETITLFHFNEKSQLLTPVNQCIFYEKENLFAVRLRKPGIYSIIALPQNPLLHKTIEMFCSFRFVFEALPSKARIEFKDKLCQLILCDTKGFLKDIEGRFVKDGSKFPKTSCQTCLKIPEHILPHMPECYIFPTVKKCHTSTWQNAGIYNVSGCIKKLSIVGNYLFAMSPNGGLWRLNLTRINSDWVPLSDQLNSISLRAFCVAPSNHSIIYLVNDIGSFYKSIDAGLSWTQTTNFTLHYNVFTHPKAEVCIRVLSSNEDNIFMSCGVGFYNSIDGGENWSQLKTGYISDFALDPQNENIIYLAEASVGVFKSKDAGTSWTHILDLTLLPIVFEFGNTKLSLGIRSQNGSLQTDTNRKVVALVGTHIITSENGGSTWALPIDLIPQALNSDGDLVRSGQQGRWCYAVAIDPFNSNHIMAAHVMLRISADGGRSWGEGVKAGHEDFQFICFDPSVKDVIFLANDGGVFKSTNGSSSTLTWINLNTGLYTAEFYRVGVQGNKAVGNMYHSGLQGTTNISDKKSTWERANLGERGLNNNLEFSQVYACPKIRNRFYVIHTPTSGLKKPLMRLRFPGTGENGIRTRQDFLYFAPKSLEFAPYTGLDVKGRLNTPPAILAIDIRPDSNVILCCANQIGVLDGTGGGRLMKTFQGNNEVSWNETGDYLGEDNVGATSNIPTWKEEINHPKGFVSVAFSPENNGKAFCITSNGELFTCNEVNDINAIWNLKGTWSVTNEVRQIAINYSDDNIIYAITETAIGISLDGGITWVNIDVAALPKTFFNTIAANPFDHHTIYLGTDMGVFASFDDGQSWTNFGPELPNVEVTQIFLNDGNLYAVTHGRGLWVKSICPFVRMVV